MESAWIEGEPEIAGEYLAVVIGHVGTPAEYHYRAIRDYCPAKPVGRRWALGGSCYQVSHYQALPELPVPAAPVTV